jgi:hypothetical protein
MSADQPKLTVEEALAELAAGGGAVLWFQVSDDQSFEYHAFNGALRFDEDTDCYVHPDAGRYPDDEYGFAGYYMGAA